MFIFGREGQNCDAIGNCKCWCQLNAYPNGTCEHMHKPQYDLYRYINTLGMSSIDKLHIIPKPYSGDTSKICLALYFFFFTLNAQTCTQLRLFDL